MHQGITYTISLLLPCERELVKYQIESFPKLVRYYNMGLHECKYNGGGTKRMVPL
jgi:hypothetical protein